MGTGVRVGRVKPGLPHRRYSVPETVMRKYVLTKARSESSDSGAATVPAPTPDTVSGGEGAQRRAASRWSNGAGSGSDRGPPSPQRQAPARHGGSMTTLSRIPPLADPRASPGLHDARGTAPRHQVATVSTQLSRTPILTFDNASDSSRAGSPSQSTPTKLSGASEVQNCSESNVMKSKKSYQYLPVSVVHRATPPPPRAADSERKEPQCRPQALGKSSAPSFSSQSSALSESTSGRVSGSSETAETCSVTPATDLSFSTPTDCCTSPPSDRASESCSLTPMEATSDSRATTSSMTIDQPASDHTTSTQDVTLSVPSEAATHEHTPCSNPLTPFPESTEGEATSGNSSAVQDQYNMDHIAFMEDARDEKNESPLLKTGKEWISSGPVETNKCSSLILAMAIVSVREQADEQLKSLEDTSAKRFCGTSETLTTQRHDKIHEVEIFETDQATGMSDRDENECHLCNGIVVNGAAQSETLEVSTDVINSETRPQNQNTIPVEENKDCPTKLNDNEYNSTYQLIGQTGTTLLIPKVPEIEIRHIKTFKVISPNMLSIKSNEKAFKELALASPESSQPKIVVTNSGQVVNVQEKHKSDLQEESKLDPKIVPTESDVYAPYRWHQQSEEDRQIRQTHQRQRFWVHRRLVSASTLPPTPARDPISSCVGTGSSYRRVQEEQLVVPRYSALPRSLSMLVNTSSGECSSNSDSEGLSLADSLEDGPSPASSKTEFSSKHDNKPVRGDIVRLLPEGNSQWYHQKRVHIATPRGKGKAFFVSMTRSPADNRTKSSTHKEGDEDDQLLLSQSMPNKLKEKLSQRQRQMQLKKQQRQESAESESETAAKQKSPTQGSIKIKHNTSPVNSDQRVSPLINVKTPLNSPVDESLPDNVQKKKQQASVSTQTVQEANVSDEIIPESSEHCLDDKTLSQEQTSTHTMNNPLQTPDSTHEVNSVTVDNVAITESIPTVMVTNYESNVTVSDQETITLKESLPKSETNVHDLNLTNDDPIVRPITPLHSDKVDESILRQESQEQSSVETDTTDVRKHSKSAIPVKKSPISLRKLTPPAISPTNVQNLTQKPSQLPIRRPIRSLQQSPPIRRSANLLGNRFHQQFEVIPEERSGSLESSAEDQGRIAIERTRRASLPIGRLDSKMNDENSNKNKHYCNLVGKSENSGQYGAVLPKHTARPYSMANDDVNPRSNLDSTLECGSSCVGYSNTGTRRSSMSNLPTKATRPLARRHGRQSKTARALRERPKEREDSAEACYKGKAALAPHAEDKDLLALSKGWINFYLLKNSRGTPEDSTAEDEKEERVRRRSGPPIRTVTVVGAEEDRLRQFSVRTSPFTALPELKSGPNSRRASLVSAPESDHSTVYLQLPSPRLSMPGLLEGSGELACSESSSSVSSSSDSEPERMPSPALLPIRWAGRQSRRGRQRSRSRHTPSYVPAGGTAGSGWTVTVAGSNSCPQQAPDLEMRLSFPACARHPPASQSDSGLGEDNNNNGHHTESGVNMQQQQTEHFLPPAQPVLPAHRWTLTVKNQSQGTSERTPEVPKTGKRPFQCLPDLGSHPGQNKNSKKAIKRIQPGHPVSSVTKEDIRNMAAQGRLSIIWPKVHKIMESKVSIRKISGQFSHEVNSVSQLLENEEGHMVLKTGLAVTGSAITPEKKPRVPTMSERDLTRGHTARR